MVAFPFGPFLPDLADLDHPGSLIANNVIPADQNHYAPFAALVTTTSALPSRCMGAVTAVDSLGTKHQFAGTVDKLFHLSGNTWVDVSRTAGGPYTTSADGFWSFTRYGDRMIAGNGADATQSYLMTAGPNFTALSATAPISDLWTTARDFTFCGRISGFVNRVQWGPIDNPGGTWGTVPVTQADYQDLPDSGKVMGLAPTAAGSLFVFTERAINLFTYEGPPAVWRRDQVARLGCAAERTLVSFEEMHFFYSEEGFHALSGAGQITPIGARKINMYFARTVNPSLLSRITAAIDPVNRLYIVAYPSTASTSNPDSALIYSFNRDLWSTATFDCELLYNYLTGTSYNVDNVDGLVSPGIDTEPWASMSVDALFWLGSGRLIMGGFDTAHKAGGFLGPSLEAKLMTREVQPAPGRRARLISARPMVDGGAVSIRFGSRNLQGDSVVYTIAQTPNLHGLVPTRNEGRYQRAEITIAAGGTWRHAMGLDELQVMPGAPR